ncbi:outer membrane protein assembly factor BamE [Niveibacterium umoris]|uniref:Outer membrane protein assembly factor BamE n=1 Tax=Niveibacterium umoris TaxID=1193620 RepID=A0A840BFX0_9RHOO|nr:outer membrane protein assembly factor BamE [Niveibacterium umoris]MBB4012075.1 outer membrane protein assembly factor BamE [Niveibacterium umoris]
MSFRPAVLLCALCLLPFAGGCDWLRPYRIDVRQGMAIDGEMVGRLKAGMTPEQVRFILGTPLLSDPFHGDRWDYPYEFRAGRSSKIERKVFSVYFKDGTLARWEGDIQPAPVNEAGLNRLVEIEPAKK